MASVHDGSSITRVQRWSAIQPFDAPATRVTHVDHYVSYVREWSGFTLRDSFLRARPAATGELGYQHMYRMKFFLDAVGGIGVCRTHPSSAQHDRYYARAISFLPAQSDGWVYAEHGGEFRVVTLAFDQESLERRLGTEVDTSALGQPRYNFASTAISDLARRLSDESRAPDEYSALYADSLLSLLLVEMLRGANAESKPRRGGLTRAQRTRVLDYLEANLDKPVRLAELAALTGLSVSYFCHAFKQSLGVAPYRWQLNQRIETAQRLLVESTEPLASLARSLGFADQSHFTRVFRRNSGCTPAAWRRERRALTHTPADAERVF